MNVTASNWAIEGWAINGNGSGHMAFVANGCLSTTDIIHHVAFINDVAYNTGVGFGAEDCGMDTNVPGNGVDYWAAVGGISQDGNLIPICSAALVDVGPANYDSIPGTHVFISGIFSYRWYQ